MFVTTSSLPTENTDKHDKHEAGVILNVSFKTSPSVVSLNKETCHIRLMLICTICPSLLSTCPSH